MNKREFRDANLDSRIFANKISAKGFTLVELLIITSILAIIALAIASTFAGGLNVYERVQRYGGVQADVLLFLEKIERDLRNTIESSEIDFIGDKETISFAGIIDTIDRRGNHKTSLGRIVYYASGRKNILVREEQDYPQAVLKLSKGKGQSQDLVSIDKIRFSYYYFNPETEEYSWKDEWEVEETKGEGRGTRDEEESEIPLGVKVEVTFKHDGRNTNLFRKVFIPVAG